MRIGAEQIRLKRKLHDYEEFLPHVSDLFGSTICMNMTWDKIQIYWMVVLCCVVHDEWTRSDFSLSRFLRFRDQEMQYIAPQSVGNRSAESKNIFGAI